MSIRAKRHATHVYGLSDLSPRLCSRVARRHKIPVGCLLTEIAHIDLQSRDALRPRQRTDTVHGVVDGARVRAGD